MNKITKYLMMACVAILCLASCKETETYAEQKEREMGCINNFIAKTNITVISEDQFLKDTITDITKNEYVLFKSTGVYMQIVDRGTGEMLKSGEGCDVLCRFTEFNINADSVQLSNEMKTTTAMYPDCMAVRNTSGTFSASFKQSNGQWGVMYRKYESSQVPSGWLVPLSYIRLGRSGEPAEVNIIVPHDQGTTAASSSVYATHYTISYKKGL